MPSLEENRNWSERMIAKVDPAFRHRWEAFADLLCHHLTKETVWVDVGCGENEMVEIYGERAKVAA